MECLTRVQTLQLNLTGMVEWLEVRNCAKEILLRPCSKDFLVLMQLSQIAKIVQLFGLKKVEKRHAGTWLSRSRIDSGKLEQVRRADQALYPIQSGSFVGRGPWLYATSPCIGLEAETDIAIEINNKKRRKPKSKKQQNRNHQVEEIFHLFRCSTHTCSETSYRIIDVECIGRAKTTQ